MNETNCDLFDIISNVRESEQNNLDYINLVNIFFECLDKNH